MNNALKYVLVFSLVVVIPLLLSLWLIPSFMVLLLGAVLVAYVLSPIVQWAERFCGRGLSAFVLTFVLPIILVEWLITIVPTIVSSLQRLIKDFPAAYDKKIVPFLTDQTDSQWHWAAVSQHIPYDTLNQLQFQLFGNVFEFTMYAMLFLVLALILLRDWKAIVSAIQQLLHDTTPDRWNDEIDSLFTQIGGAISLLIRGQLELSTLLAVYYGVSFHLLSLLASGEWHFVSAWLLIGIVTGYLNILPYIGVPLGGLLAGLLGVMTYQLDVLWLYPALLIVVTIGVTIDHKLLTPRIIGRSVRVHEIFVYFAVYLGMALGGLVGIVLALPAMAVISVCIRYFYQHWLSHRDSERQQLKDC